MKLALSITHAAHRPERVASFERLRSQVGSTWDFVHVESDPMPCHEWSLRQWQWALDCGADATVFLQDDVTVCERFHEVAAAIAEAGRDRIVCLHSNHPRAAALAEAGHHWYTSADGLVGNGYILGRAQLEGLLHFRRACVVDPADWNEDTLIDAYAMATEQRIYHCVPSPIDHDTSLPSTWGADHHAHRRPYARIVPDMHAIDWTIPDGVLHVGRIYMGNHWRLVTDTTSQAREELDLVKIAYRLSREPWK